MVDEKRHVGETVGSVIQTLRRQPLLVGAVVAFLLLCALSTALGTAIGLANFRDVGYPDSSDLLESGKSFIPVTSIPMVIALHI